MLKRETAANALEGSNSRIKKRFIKALWILIYRITYIKIWFVLSSLTYNKIFLSAGRSLSMFRKSIITVARKVSKKWQRGKQWEVDSSSILHEQSGFNVSWKCLNLCFCKWLETKRSLVINLMLIASLILYTLLVLGWIKFNCDFWNIL